MRKGFYLNNTRQLCNGNTLIQYDFGRGAKIDLCLERVHEFLERRKSTTLRLEALLNGEDEKAKKQLLRKHDLIYFKEPSSLKDALDMFYEGIDTFLQSFSDLLVEKSNYPEKPFRLTRKFLLRAKKD